MTTPANPPDLIAWLRQQLDDDADEIAKHPDGEDDWVPGSLYATREQNYPCDPYLGISKRRALAEVDAKRRILDQVVDEATGLDMQVDQEFRVGSRDEVAEPYLGDVLLRLLALPYVDRPGYRDEWRLA